MEPLPNISRRFWPDSNNASWWFPGLWNAISVLFWSVGSWRMELFDSNATLGNGAAAGK
jgi:hypothetical protein